MILLDTHVVIWLALSPEKLSRKAQSAILEARKGGGLAAAAITLWEIAWLVTRGRIQASGQVAAFVHESAEPLIILPITPEIAIRAAQLPGSFPRDPQDRLIGATALVENLPLITADEHIRRSDVLRIIW